MGRKNQKKFFKAPENDLGVWKSYVDQGDDVMRKNR